MNKEVLVSIKGLQFVGEESPDPIEVITPGEYFYKNEKHYTLFEEILSETKDITKTTLIFSKEEVVLKRSGALNVQMIFNLGNKTVSSYRTPFGNIMIGVKAKQINIEEASDEIRLNVEYGMDVNYEFLADCRLDVKIKSRT